ncbi:Probable sodium/metabolite cotransporter BASS6-chloroplastic [Striga hermonthica]|uniref:Probable sodium/metabolite cotransporter BASS6-chloroplastic n=1 Tax=Striga hermonthica TaxID=68872 RepID=A0A9N7P424_STRHE|nr:Probable sodium/metabolite cotransporter BASS6-chloroplastic [Striga hermonthica]
MSASGKLLNHRPHFHGRHSFIQSENRWLKSTGVTAFSSPKNLNRSNFSGLCLRSLQSHSGSGKFSRAFIVCKGAPENSPPEQPSDHAFGSLEIQDEISLMTILKGANSFLPQVVLASTVLAIIYPPSFSWFTNRYYAPALGFLMFAVGVNSSEKDFLKAFSRPAAIIAGYIGQFVVKPLLGYFFGTISMTIFGLPTSLGAGIMLTSCVSGAQLSNYATFLTDPEMAPLSIVMTSISTATAVFVTPFLSLLLIGKKLPVDVKGMVSNILQIVVTPIAIGLLLNRFFPKICNAIRPFLPPLSVFVTALCVGAPLAINVESVMSPSGISILLLVIAFHLSAFIAGYSFTGLIFRDSPDVKALQRTLSYETGMQSSLLALALANKFFQDPLVSIPPAISTVIMSLMGFSLVMLWAHWKQTALQ